MATDIDQMFANLRRPVFTESPNSVPQEVGSQNGNIAPSGWLEDDSVSSDVIQASAVIADKISAGAVEADKIAANAVTATKIAAGAVETDKLAANAVTAVKIAANTITANEIASNAITANELAANSVTTAKIVAGDVTSSRIELTLSGKNFGANNGSTAAPGIYFDSNSAVGLYYSSPIVGLVTNQASGQPIQTWNATGKTVTANIEPDSSGSRNLGSSTAKWNTVFATNGTINTSDRNLKQDIQDAPLGLGFIRKLKPRIFRWKSTPDTQAQEQAEAAFDQQALDAELEPHLQDISEARSQQRAGKISDKTAEQRVEKARVAIAAIERRHVAPVVEANAKQREGRRYHYGLIAQEVKEALDAEGLDAAFWQQSDEGIQSLAYTELIGPLIKAVQELAAEVEVLKEQVHGKNGG